MTPVFLDTSAITALGNTADQWFDAATECWTTLKATNRRSVTTSLVLIEVGDGLSRVHQRQLALDLRRRLLNTPRVDVIRVGQDIELRAWKLYEQRLDKEWGMTDCISMVVMEELGLSDVFTFDQHFRQAGFRTIP